MQEFPFKHSLVNLIVNKNDFNLKGSRFKTHWRHCDVSLTLYPPAQ